MVKCSMQVTCFAEMFAFLWLSHSNHLKLAIMRKILLSLPLMALISANVVTAQYVPKAGSDATTPLHLLRPNYPVPYSMPQPDSIMALAKRIFNYLDAATPFEVVNKKTGKPVTDFSQPDTNVTIKPGDFRLTSYEWGVTYSAMLRMGHASGDAKFTKYTTDRHAFLAKQEPYFRKISEAFPDYTNPLKQVIMQHALDDAGAVCASMIKGNAVSRNDALLPLINRYIDYISNREFRLTDGTFARNRPQPNTLWLDDMYMSVPALAQMGKMTGDKKYFDDAVKQVLQFSARMFNASKGIYMHGWVQGMEPHPQFHWGRANGWALMAMSELLDVLPKDHEGYTKVLAQFKLHAAGLAAYQSGSGFWHQLLDRTDSYLETSATAIYAYCFAHGINQGWLDVRAFGPAAVLAWNVVTTKVNKEGQVEGTCVGTGMGFDPAFYYHRPVSAYAAHGYGPVLLAAADMLLLVKQHKFSLNDSALMFTE